MGSSGAKPRGHVDDAVRGVASPARKIAVRWASHVPVYSASGILLPVV